MRKEKLTLYCDQDQATDIKRRAASQSLSMSAYIFKLVSNELPPSKFIPIFYTAVKHI